MKILGVVLAGGQSRRFGSDKALALFEGRSLLEHAIAGLGAMAHSVVVAGRDEAPVATIADRPESGMGPLGGIAAALALAAREGFDAVLSCPVDAIGLPHDLPALLSPPPAYVASQPVIGLWSAALLAPLDVLLAGSGRHSLIAFAEAVQARAVTLPVMPGNINRPRDLAQWAEGWNTSPAQGIDP